jgi:hypothetical protein
VHENVLVRRLSIVVKCADAFAMGFGIDGIGRAVRMGYVNASTSSRMMECMRRLMLLWLLALNK